MKSINKLSFKLLVPQINFDSPGELSLADLENFYERILSEVGLICYTNELGSETDYRNNLVNTASTLADFYYLPFNKTLETTPLREIVGLKDSNYFKTIYQVCVLLKKNWNTLQKYRNLSINEYSTHILFPFINNLNEKCLGNIGVWYGSSTFKSGLKLNKSKHQNSSIRYYGQSLSGLIIILPCDNQAEFLKSNLCELSKDYKSLSLEEFKNEIILFQKQQGFGKTNQEEGKKLKKE